MVSYFFGNKKGLPEKTFYDCSFSLEGCNYKTCWDIATTF